MISLGGGGVNRVGGLCWAMACASAVRLELVHGYLHGIAKFAGSFTLFE